MELLRANPKLSMREMTRVLREEIGIKRGKDWVSEKRYELLQENGGKLSGAGGFPPPKTHTSTPHTKCG